MKKDMNLRILFTVVGIVFIYGAAAFNAKIAIGVSPLDAAIATLAQITGIKSGTSSMIFHGSFFLGQLVLLRKKVKSKDFLQLFFIIGGGTVWNFFLYTVLKSVEFTLYPVRLLVFVLSNIVSAFGCLLVIDMNIMPTPLEGFVQMLADRKNKTLGTYRQIADILFIAFAVILTLFCDLSWTIREGTIISAMIFGPALDLLRKHVVSKWKFLQDNSL